MFSHLSLECVLLLLLLLLTRSLEVAYTVELGQNAQLPCTYQPDSSGALVPVCWGKGACPMFNCPNVLLRTDERDVTYTTSGRYQLQRDFHKGDVSLTITHVTLGDSGTYCCRVQFPGLMNDGKFNVELVITPSETKTLRTLRDKNQTQTFPLANEVPDSGATTRIRVYIGAGVCAGVALVLIFGALILMWYSHRKRKLQNASFVSLANLPPSGSANAGAEGICSEENIYTIKESVYPMEDPSEHYCSVSKGQQA